MNQSVVKALGLLDFFTKEQKELSLRELAEKAELTKPTAYRLLSSLEECGFLKKVKTNNQDARYRLGLKLLDLGSLVAEQLELREVALPFMKKLSVDINEVVHLVILDKDEAVYIEKVETNNAIRLYTRVGKRSELYIGSGPKLLLAFLTQKEQQLLVENMDFIKLTEYTIGSKEELLKELEKIRGNGFSLSRSEQDVGTVGVSYPIYNYNNQVVAALNVSGFEVRFNENFMEEVKRKTKQTALCISKELGYIKE